MMCADLVDVRWKDRSGRSRRTVASLEDISVSGACLQLDMEILPQTELRISYPTGEYSGVVRYCKFNQIGYFVGVQFETGSKWSKARFEPMHLLDPRDLVVGAPKRGTSGSKLRSLG